MKPSRALEDEALNTRGNKFRDLYALQFSAALLVGRSFTFSYRAHDFDFFFAVSTFP